MRTKAVVLATMLLVAWGLKRHYADASADQLTWILTPTGYLVAAVTGIGFEWRSGEGYFSPDHMFLIEKSCAGVNFMIAAFAMLVTALLHRGSRASHAIGLVVGAFVVSYASAVVVNTVRIGIALWLPDRWLPTLPLNAGDVHRLEGIVVYFGGLVLLHELARRFDRRVIAMVRTS